VPTEDEGETMAHIDTQRLMKFDHLSATQKDDLKKRFHDRKRELEAALRAVDLGLAALEETA
jgi:hypothetical protein